MKRFTNILLVFEEGARGKAALERAATLAKENVTCCDSLFCFWSSP